MNAPYKEIVEHYESCLEKHGDNHLGVDWPKPQDVDTRYAIMLDVIRLNEIAEKDISLLDFGCGTGHLLEFINRKGLRQINYSGLDISRKFVDVASSKFPDTIFYCGDILNTNFQMPIVDYVVMNGVFTEKRNLSFEEMWMYFTTMIGVVYKHINKGFAFNVMSKNVDWEREDLFHVSLDLLSNYLCKNVSREFVVRNDYGLYEYTVYVYKR